MKGLIAFDIHANVTDSLDCGDISSEFSTLLTHHGVLISAPDSELHIAMNNGEAMFGNKLLHIKEMSSGEPTFFMVIRKEINHGYGYTAAIWTKSGEPSSTYMLDRFTHYIDFLRDSNITSKIWSSKVNSEVDKIVDNINSGAITPQ